MIQDLFVISGLTRVLTNNSTLVSLLEKEHEVLSLDMTEEVISIQFCVETPSAYVPWQTDLFMGATVLRKYLRTFS